MKLSQIELDITKELINLGLSKAADSMSFFVKDTVLLKGLDLQLIELSQMNRFSMKTGDEIHLLTTELKGEMAGVCFLVFDEQDANTIIDLSLPPAFRNDPQKRKEMGTAFLLELDNIISAAVVTQFSDFLGLGLYGYVPKHEEVNGVSLQEEISSKITFQSHILYFKVNLLTNEDTLNPEFIWALDERFINGIKEFIDNPENAIVIQKIRAELEK